MNRITSEPRGSRFRTIVAITLLAFALPGLAQADLVPMVFRPALAGMHPVGHGTSPTVEKIAVTSQDDLPRHTYGVTGSVVELIESSEAFGPWAANVRSTLEADLEKYDIQDKTSMKGYLSTLMTLDIISGDWEGALAKSQEVAGLEDKEAAKLLSGVGLRARIAAIEATGSTEPTPEFRAAFREALAMSYADLPWDVVGDNLEGSKSQLEMVSANLLLGLAQQQIEPIVEKAGEVSGGIAAQIISFHWMLHGGLDLKDESIAVLTEIIGKNRVEKADIWAARDVDLAGIEGLTPVNVAVWDTGVDIEIFDGQLVVNDAETVNGKDDDGNGWIDDRHGIATDLHSRRTTGLLYSMDEATRPIDELKNDMKGLFDMRAAIDSPEAGALRKKFASLGTDGVKPLIEDLGRYSHYCHGTHVAGIAVAGNPAARIFTCRLTGDPRMVPDAPTLEDAERSAQSFQDIVAYYKNAGVRVVNMSWVISASSFEAGLEANGVGASAEERKTMGREMFEVTKAGLEKAFRSAPEILFVGGAGNSDNDIEFDEFVPPAFRLPNLMIAGAVDQAGDATSFTSFGPTVNVYSNGFEVDSYVPGGDRMKLSGTSMASPNVVNLGAKLFAIEPSLSPADVIELIREGCDVAHEGDQEIHIMNPKRSVELLRERQGA